MNFSQEQDPTKRAAGVGVVILLHILLIYALINGLARKVVEVVKAPLETKIIQDIKPPPPQPPPPPPPKLPPPPPLTIPPPELVTAPPPVPPPVTATVARVPALAPPHVATAAPASYTPTAQSGSCTPPEYPAASERLGEAGKVVLSLLIGADGRVLSSKVETSSGFTRLDQAAKEALSLCHFAPALVEGKPTQAWGRLAYVFKVPD